MNENDNQRGLHIAVINPTSSKVEFSKVFDTYTSSKPFEDYIRSATIPEGHIVAAACQDDAASELSWEVKTWFGTMGSRQIRDLEYRQGWCFIGTFGKLDGSEKSVAEK